MTLKAQSERAPLNIAVVGMGYWGPNLVRAVSEMRGADLRWICDNDPSRLDVLTRRYPSVRSTAEIGGVLEDPGVDAVLIATPVYTHFDLAARSLEAGKHVFVEKPLAPSAPMASDLIGRAEAAGLTLMCGHTFIYSPPVREIRRLLERNELGEIFFVSSNRVNLGLHQRDISVVWDLGPHDFSILLYLLDEVPRSVRAVGRDSIVPGIPDVAFVTLAYDSGIVANVELSWLAPSKLRRTVIVGSEKMVVYDDGASEPVRIFDHGVIYKDPETFGEYQLSYRTGDILSPNVPSDEPLVDELGDFVSAVRFGHEPDASLPLAKHVVELAEAADESLRLGGSEIVVGNGEPRLSVGQAASSSWGEH